MSVLVHHLFIGPGHVQGLGIASEADCLGSGRVSFLQFVVSRLPPVPCVIQVLNPSSTADLKADEASIPSLEPEDMGLEE